MLIELWMSQDYLNTNESRKNELTGEIYFDDLVRRSFFQDVEVDDESGNLKCKIHDIVHDFLQYLSKNDCLIQDTDVGVGESKVVPSDKVHHVNLVEARESDDLRSILNYRKLRTFIATLSSKTVIGPMFELIVEMKCLRTLSLCHPDIRGLWETAGFDKYHFRDLKELPRAVLNFYNLQTLRLVGCSSLAKVDVGMLINLRHLFVKNCWYLALIKGIEKLTHLRTLDEFRSLGISGETNMLEDLKDLNQLQGSLTLQILEISNVAEDNAAGTMLNKAHLQQLRLDFFIDSDGGWQSKMMSVLEPHQALESLSISDYNGDAFSNWLLTLHNLRDLTLSWCINCVILPALGKLASLESLEIVYLNGVSKVGAEFLGIIEGELAQSSSHFISFPKLKKLKMADMNSLDEWEGVVEENSDNLTIMPCLSQLTIDCCHCLKVLPDFLWNTPLQKLNIEWSPILKNLYEIGTGEEWAKISHIPTITIN